MNETTITDLHAEMQAVIANLESREWIQGREVDGNAVCAHGAVQTCEALQPGDEHIIRAVMRSRGVTEEWNDTDGRTKAEVLARMRQIEVTDADLALTFGPNWRQVVVLIRRTAALTLDEAKQLSAAARDAAWAAARDAAWAAARAAARDAAWDAAIDAVRDAAWATARDAASAAAWAAASAAAWDAARYAAWDAARYAASATVVADLVGQYGLTQNHIDTLMKPWTDVLGQDWAEGVMPS